MEQSNTLNKEWFVKALQKRDISLSYTQISLFDEYKKLLLEWNSKVNLISRKSEKLLWSIHFYHCASLFFVANLLPYSRIVDIGTGGGLPGIVLKILRPDLQVLLIDSIKKKSIAVESIAKILKLDRIEIMNGRAEEISRRKKYSHKYDYVIVRAVAPLKNIVKWANPFIAMCKMKYVGEGYIKPLSIIAYKGGAIEKEVRDAMKTNLVQSFKVYDLNLGEGGDEFKDKKIVTLKIKEEIKNKK